MVLIKVLTVLTVALPTVAAVLFWAWPEPARPHVPVPQLLNVPSPERVLFYSDLVPLQQGLVPVPMQVTGRTATGARGSLLQEWPAFHVEARFRGTEVSIRFEDHANRWRIEIDQGRTARIELSRPGARDLRIRSLPAGDHLIRVEKISESSMPSSFGGILVPSLAQVLPVPSLPDRLIEFIGDSDTVGFANGALRRDCSEEEVFATTDASRSFGPQVAAALDADYRMIARSGIGLVRNFEGVNPQATMTSRYPLALPSQPMVGRTLERKADIVVIGLGSNDFGSSFAKGEPWSDQQVLSADFETTLIDFLRDRANETPDALLVLLAFGEYGEALVHPYQQAKAALAAEGRRVLLVTLPELQRSACLWHPSAADHELIANALITAITGATDK